MIVHRHNEDSFSGAATGAPAKVYGLTDSGFQEAAPAAEVATRFGIKPTLYSEASVQAVVDSLETSGWINVGYTQSKIGMSRFSKK